jgi:hypothetical protein
LASEIKSRVEGVPRNLVREKGIELKVKEKKKVRGREKKGKKRNVTVDLPPTPRTPECMVRRSMRTADLGSTL